MWMMTRSRLGLALLVALSAAGCNGDSGPSGSGLALAKAPTKSGDGQTAPVGTKLTNALRVVVTRDGVPVSGETVDWLSSAGSLDPSSVTSDIDGIAVTSWTLGSTAGTQAASASLTGATGSPVAFSAQATSVGPPPPAGPTIEVLGPDGGNRFDPASITVTLGTTVTWHWPAGSLAHNVVGDNVNMPDGSGPLTNGEHTYTFTFNTLGTYRFYCANHGGPGGAGMSGSVTVTAVD